VKISVIGNCQIAALNPILRMMNPSIEIVNFPAVHTLQESNRREIEENLKTADWIFTQPIGAEYPVDFVRTAHLKAAYPGKTILWPVAYFSGYAPDWDVLRDASKDHYPGPLLSYHSSKILFAFFSGMNMPSAVQFFLGSTEFDSSRYGDAVAASLNNLKSRERELNVRLSDYIEERFRDRRLFHIMNHPDISVMAEIGRRLLELVGEKYINLPEHLFTDFDLISAWHPENAFVRQSEKFSFSASSFSRGANLLDDGHSATGFQLGLPRIYTAPDLVGAFYRF
jgi:hypothetical protein